MFYASVCGSYSIALVTLFEQLDAFAELTQAFVRVDPFRNVAAGMAEDAAFCRLVGSGIIKQCRHRVPAVMRSMAIGMDVVHDSTPYRAVPPIAG